MFEKVSFVFVFLGDEPQPGRLLLQWYLTNGMVYGLSGKGFYPRLAKRKIYESQLGRLLLQWYLTNGMVYGLPGKASKFSLSPM